MKLIQYEVGNKDKAMVLLEGCVEVCINALINYARDEYDYLLSGDHEHCTLEDEEYFGELGMKIRQLGSVVGINKDLTNFTAGDIKTQHSCKIRNMIYEIIE